MTTIAYRDGVLAVDSGVFDVDRAMFIGNMQKVVELQNGALWAHSGDADDRELASLLGMTLDGAMPTERQLLETNVDSDGILVFPSGSIYSVSVTPKETKQYKISAECLLIRDKFYATGSGRQIAYGAMEHGATAIEAIECAARRNVYTRLPVQHLSFKTERKK